MKEKDLREKYEAAGKRALLVLTRCKRLFKGDGLYIPTKVVQGNADATVIVGWAPSQGFCVDLGDDQMVVASNPLDAPRLHAALSAMPKLYEEARRLRDEHAGLLDEGSLTAEEFLRDVTESRKPEDEPPAWP